MIDEAIAKPTAQILNGSANGTNLGPISVGLDKITKNSNKTAKIIDIITKTFLLILTS